MQGLGLWECAAKVLGFGNVQPNRNCAAIPCRTSETASEVEAPARGVTGLTAAFRLTLPVIASPSAFFDGHVPKEALAKQQQLLRGKGAGAGGKKKKKKKAAGGEGGEAVGAEGQKKKKKKKKRRRRKAMAVTDPLEVLKGGWWWLWWC